MKQDKIKQLKEKLDSYQTKNLIGGLIKNELNNNPLIKALEFLQKSVDIQPALDLINQVQKEFDDNYTELQNELTLLIESTRERLEGMTVSEVSSVLEKFTSLDQKLEDQKNNFQRQKEALISDFNSQVLDLKTTIKDTGVIQTKLADSVNIRFDSTYKANQAVADDLLKLRKEFLSKLGNIGHGGNANRNIAINGNTSVLSASSPYTDINLKAGSNVTITYVKNNGTKYTDITISSSGGGGSVGGTVRSINNISTSQTAGADSGTDYVYICSAGIALTLPTAVVNTNQYTVKNTSTSSVVIIPDGSETIDAATNIIMPLRYTSVDLISDQTSNWNIT